MVAALNPAMVTLLGYTADILTSKPFTEFIHPDDRKKVLSSHLERMRGGTPPTGYMFRLIGSGGEEKWVWINSTRTTWSGQPASLSFLTDMTEQKKAEERLVSANREYTSLLSQIQDVYYRTDREGRLVRASRSWATLFGYNDVSECIGMSIADGFYVNPGERKQVLEEIYRNGKITDYEVWVKKKDGVPLTPEEIREYCQGKISHFKIPRYYKFVDDFPMSVTGKIQKYKMREASITELGLEAASKIETA